MKPVDFILLAVLLPAIGWALYKTIRGFREGNLCSGSCEGCQGCSRGQKGAGGSREESLSSGGNR